MPTMNTRERPRIAVIVSNNCCSLPIAPSVRNTTWRTMPVSPSLSVSAARIAGTISVPPRACSALDERGGFTDTRGIRRHGGRKQHVHGVVETDDVETVGRLETGERVE